MEHAPARPDAARHLKAKKREAPADAGASSRRAVPGFRPTVVNVDYQRVGPPASGGPTDADRALLNGLAMERQIEAFALDFLADAKPDHHVNDLENDQGDDDVIGEHDRHA